MRRRVVLGGSDEPGRARSGACSSQRQSAAETLCENTYSRVQSRMTLPDCPEPIVSNAAL
jgi:hypothetical protein